LKYYIIAGEASGDKHGAMIMREIIHQDANAIIRYWGGDEMEKQISEPPITHYKDMAFMGFVEVIKNLPTILSFFSKAKADITKFKPDVLLLIDYPGFNLRMAKWAHNKGIKVVHYISPSVWAWNEGRVKTVKKYIDRMICILPFEVPFYEARGVKAYYYGNPIIDHIKALPRNGQFLKKYGIQNKIIALLPGSRIQEIERILPIMIEAVKDFSKDYDVVIAQADSLPDQIYNFIEKDGNIKAVRGHYHDILMHAHVAIVTSGTATLEAALHHVPQVVCYKTSSFTYHVAKRLVKLKYISLVNLIPDQLLVTELIQDNCDVENMNQELKKLLSLTEVERSHFYNSLTSLLTVEHSAEKIAASIIEVGMS
jgi:lipid-A-disaccharide synthase